VIIVHITMLFLRRSDSIRVGVDVAISQIHSFAVSNFIINITIQVLFSTIYKIVVKL
jgi:hypothetical protein